MPDLNPEQRARVQIDGMLTASEWLIQDYKSRHFTVCVIRLLAIKPIRSAGLQLLLPRCR
jgi:hypothetical protein